MLLLLLQQPVRCYYSKRKQPVLCSTVWRRSSVASAMRRTRGRLAEHRDDLHSMSANSAVTLMKEAVDSAIKHGDIRLDAVCSMQSTLALRI